MIRVKKKKCQIEVYLGAKSTVQFRIPSSHPDCKFTITTPKFVINFKTTRQLSLLTTIIIAPGKQQLRSYGDRTTA